MRGGRRFHISPENGQTYEKLRIENAELKTKLEAKEIEFANLKEDALNTDKARENWLQLARNQAMEIKLLRRALCLEKAEKAKENKFLWHVYFRTNSLHYCSENGDRTRMNPFKRIAQKSYKEWIAFWGNLEENYRKLAEKLK